MTDRPILFSGPMVRAILSGAKTETRRVVKFAAASPADVSTTRPPDEAHMRVEGFAFNPPAPVILGSVTAIWREPRGTSITTTRCPYGVPGDRMWVRETWSTWSFLDKTKPSEMTPGQSLSYQATPGLLAGRWRPPIHMPRWASRLTLAVEAVRVERLHDIDDAGARAEGVADREAFRALWRDINGAESWDANPWVWVVGFSRVQP